MDKLTEIKKEYYRYLDRKARNIAYNLVKLKPATKLILYYTQELYKSAKIESCFENANFETAYHSPISSDLEFLVARTLVHYSSIKKLNWNVYLRRQVGKAAPDIRIDRDGKCIAIVEVKAKVGWIQCFFSTERYKKDLEKSRKGHPGYDPREVIRGVRNQFNKYIKTFHINRNRIFVFLPTLCHVHRVKSSLRLNDYRAQFAKNSGLPRKNLILLSYNLLLDLSSSLPRKEYRPTDIFEKTVSYLTKI